MKCQKLLTVFCCLFSYLLHADTMDHFMNISNQIPQMEMKADPQAQAWARSARSVLIITSETVAETLVQANQAAEKQGQPLFCLPAGMVLDAATLQNIILQTYNNLSSQQSDKDKMTVSQMAWLGVMKAYPCNQGVQNIAYQTGRVSSAQTMQHMAGLLQH